MRMWIVLFGLILANVAAADETSPQKTMGLVTVGDIDTALVERVRAFVDQNTAFYLQVLPQQPLSGGALYDEGVAVAKLLNENLVGIVALVWPEEDIKTHCVRLQDNNVTVVNVRAMKTEGIDDEKFARRVERQAMKGIGFMLGMAICPNPFCALTAYGSLDELDVTGRNFCPPCLTPLQQKAQNLGIKLNTECPNYTLD